MIYFDNAATSYPKPKQLMRAYTEYLSFYGANPGRAGHDMSLKTAEQVYKTREAVAELLGAFAPENVVFTQNCTHSLNIVLKGLLQSGDHVVISDLEHNSVFRPVYKLWQGSFVDYTIASVTEGDDDATVESFKEAMRPNTKLIACTHGSNAFGIKLPVARLAQLAHKYGAFLLADCAQTAGTEPINMMDMGIDYLAAPGHKGLYGPTGTGVLLVSPNAPVLKTIAEGGTGSNSMEYTQPDFLPDMLESGTVNTAGIIALGAGISAIKLKGTDNISRQELLLAQQLYDGIQKINGAVLYTKRPSAKHHLPVLSFNMDNEHSEETAKQLNGYDVAVRAGLHCAPLAHKKMGTLQKGTVRLSLGMFNTEKDVEEFLTILKLLKINGYKH
ncbi:MAG: aminotransferase class V-fold PLP-dependent enzyme [Hydrogenoanaerobacterium sp.]